MAFQRRSAPVQHWEDGNGKQPSVEQRDLRPIPADMKKSTPLETIVAYVLRIGAYTSVAIILVGLGLTIASALLHSTPLQPVPSTGTPAQALYLSGLLSGLRSGNPTSIIDLGLLILILTPVARVTSTVIYFLFHRDRAYLAITAFVLAVLVLGFFMGSAD